MKIRHCNQKLNKHKITLFISEYRSLKSQKHLEIMRLVTLYWFILGVHPLLKPWGYMLPWGYMKNLGGTKILLPTMKDEAPAPCKEEKLPCKESVEVLQLKSPSTDSQIFSPTAVSIQSLLPPSPEQSSVGSFLLT